MRARKVLIMGEPKLTSDLEKVFSGYPVSIHKLPAH